MILLTRTSTKEKSRVYVKERASLTRSLKATRTRTQTACLYKRDTTAPRGSCSAASAWWAEGERRAREEGARGRQARVSAWTSERSRRSFGHPDRTCVLGFLPLDLDPPAKANANATTLSPSICSGYSSPCTDERQAQPAEGARLGGGQQKKNRPAPGGDRTHEPFGLDPNSSAFDHFATDALGNSLPDDCSFM